MHSVIKYLILLLHYNNSSLMLRQKQGICTHTLHTRALTPHNFIIYKYAFKIIYNVNMDG